MVPRIPSFLAGTILVFTSPLAVNGQSASPEYLDEVERIAAAPPVAEALRLAEAHDDWALERLIELTEIPAPPFLETERGIRFGELLAELGADSVWTDDEGNVIGLRRGRSSESTVGFGGHLDTVFPKETDVSVRVAGDTLFAPGIGDDTRGLVVVLSVLRAMEEANVVTESDVYFVGVVGEEGLGDLRGMKHMYQEGGLWPDSWIDVDGGGIGRTVSMGLGSVRYRVTFQGPGGHSWGAFGTANPAHALGRAVRYFQDVADTLTRNGPRTSYNVGRLGGGTSVNSVPFESWMEIDMRSESPEMLSRVEQVLLSAVDRALTEENELRRVGDALTVDNDRIGMRPSGEMDPDHPLVQRALATTDFYRQPAYLDRSSTDSNVPIALGVPAVTIGRGGIGMNGHSPDEFWINREAYVAVQRALLLLVAQAGLASPAS